MADLNYGFTSEEKLMSSKIVNLVNSIIFIDNISQEMRNFLSKAYQIYKNQDRNDKDTLIISCFSASLLIDKNIAGFFEEKGIAYSDCAKYLNCPIEKFNDEQFNKECLQEMIDIFRNFEMHSYLNSVDDLVSFILQNDAVEQFLKTFKIDDLEGSIPKSITLYIDKKRKFLLEDFFKNVSKNAQNYINTSYKIYKEYNSNLDDQSKAEFAEIALIWSLENFQDDYYIDYYTLNFIFDIFDNEQFKAYLKNKFDIDFEFNPLLKGYRINGRFRPLIDKPLINSLENVEEMVRFYSSYLTPNNSCIENEEITIADIIKNLLSKSNHLSKDLLETLLKIKNYDDNYFLNIDQSLKQFKVKYDKKIQEYINSFKAKEYLINVYKISNSLREKDFFSNFDYSKYTSISRVVFLLALYCCDNKIVKYLEEENIHVQDIFPKVTKYDLEKAKESEIDYTEMYQYFIMRFEKSDFDKPINKDDSVITIFYNQVIDYFDFGMLMDERPKKLPFNDIFTKIYEVALKEEQTELEQIRRADNLNKFSNMSIDKLNTDELIEIGFYGQELEELTSLITEEYSKLGESNVDICKVIETKNMINSISISGKQSLFDKIRRKPFRVMDKETIDELSAFINEELTLVQTQMDKFKYAKKLIEIYVRKTSDIVAQLKTQDVIEDDLLDNNGLSQMKNGQLIMKSEIIQQKAIDFNNSIDVWYQEYQKLCMIELTHAVSVSKLITTKLSLIPAMYIDLSITNGILTEREVMSTITFIKDLLNGMDSLSTEGIAKTLKSTQIDTLLLPNDELKEEIEKLNALELKQGKKLIKKVGE